MDSDSVASYLQLHNEQCARFNTAQGEAEISCGLDNTEIEKSVRVQGGSWYATALANFKLEQRCRVEPTTQLVTSPTSASAADRLLQMDLRREMFAIPKASGDTADAIKGVIDGFQQRIRELRAMGCPVDFCDDWLVHEIVDKLAFETRKQWELALVT
ncbi:unnamed protein product [Ceratitis capitata]|uniref:(Mediterranean fruit fly) hypothetical protein n=1 Tax=Ceratitis capitata TaxID=7213 RepID=A0A811UT62_CERCA|nr:unnamed protein product [Ceratitis capitata]